MSISESENPGRSWQLALGYQPDFARPDQVIAPVVEALASLADGLFQPLGVTALLHEVDGEYGFRGPLAGLPEWRLEVDSLAPRLSAWRVPDTRVVVPAIDRAALESFLRTAAEQPAEPGDAVCPVALWLTDVKARLPWHEDSPTLAVRYKGGTQEVAVERDQRGAWVIGPVDSLLTAPVDMYGRVQGQLAQLTIDAHWSPWYQEGEAGTRAIEAAVAALEAKGWRRS